MSRLKNLTVQLHIFQFAALDRSRVDQDDTEHAVKIGVLKMLVLPFGAAAAVPLFFGGMIGPDGAKSLAVVIVLALVFGVSAYTDRVFDRNFAEIEGRANRILDDPEKGRDWARRKIAAIVLIELVAVFVLAGLGRFLMIAGTNQPFIAV